MMKRKKELKVCVALLCLLGAAGCTQENLAPAAAEDSAVVRRKVTAGMGGCPSLSAQLTMTRTAIDFIESSQSKPDTHRVKWCDGDRVYSYSESGVYMHDDLSSTGLEPSFEPSNPYEAKIEIIYREGDHWYNAYLKGSLIGDYIGRRTVYNITFHKGIPHEQRGNFSDCHICVTTAYPLSMDDIWFTNMQSYIRFKTIGNEKDDPSDPIGNAKIGGKQIARVTIRNNVNEFEHRADAEKEMMAGNVELDIEVENAWKYSLKKRTGESDALADTMVVVIPEGGVFNNTSEYYVAVPVRTYLKGMKIEFYDSAGIPLAYVNTPRVTIAYNQIYDIDDILQYVVFLCTNLDLYYDEDNDVTTPTIDCVSTSGVDIEEGHVGKLIPDFEPDNVTDKTIVWTSTNESVATVAQDGTLTAVSSSVGGGRCKVRATTATAKADGTLLFREIEVRVVPKAGLTPDAYAVSSPW